MSQTAEMPVANRLDLGEIKPGGVPHGVAGPFTAIAVFDGHHWSALCRELDIAADGESAPEAFENLKSAVREALLVAHEQGIKAGSPVSDPDLHTFLVSHRGNAPVSGLQFIVV